MGKTGKVIAGLTGLTVVGGLVTGLVVSHRKRAQNGLEDHEELNESEGERLVQESERPTCGGILRDAEA